MSEKLRTSGDEDPSIKQNSIQYPPMEPLTSKIEKEVEDNFSELMDTFEKYRFDGIAIFSDIDGTITDNKGRINDKAVQAIKKFVECGGIFVPVTGRARFDSVKDLMAQLDLPYIIMNNGAEIFDRNGERIYGSELTDEEVSKTFEIAKKYDLVWMQNKKDPQTGEEYLFSNFTEESERKMLGVGIVDTVHNEEKRIGLSAKQSTAEDVMSIPGQNYKIQMMSPDAEAIRQANKELESLGIPCMLNMQSKITGDFHWVEVIRGTKLAGIQELIDHILPEDVKTASVVGDGGNDLTMFGDLHDREGNPIPNIRTAVQNACEMLKMSADKILDSNWDSGEYGISGGGAAIFEMIYQTMKMQEIKTLAKVLGQILKKAS